MYIQLTTQCNMKCAHCMFACEPGKGEHMPLWVAKGAMEMAYEYDSPIALGGGEPTMYPQLLDIIRYHDNNTEHHEYPLFMVTNGTAPLGLWRELLDLSENDCGDQLLDMKVSSDPWHDRKMIKDHVYDWAEKNKKWWGDPASFGVWQPQRTIEPIGRARETGMEELLEDAMNHGYTYFSIDVIGCCDVRIAPDEKVYVDTLGESKCFGFLDDRSVSEAMEWKYEQEEKISNNKELEKKIYMSLAGCETEDDYEGFKGMER